MLKEPLHAETNIRLGLFMLTAMILMLILIWSTGCSTVKTLGPGMYSSEYLERTTKPGLAKHYRIKNVQEDSLQKKVDSLHFYDSLIVHYNTHKPLDPL